MDFAIYYHLWKLILEHIVSYFSLMYELLTKFDEIVIHHVAWVVFLLPLSDEA